MATAGATPLLFRASYGSAAEGELETNRLTLAKTPALCTAPQFITEELLRDEGFTEIRFVDASPSEIPADVGSGKLDFSMAYASQYVSALDNGERVTLLAGIMVGCFELFGNASIRSIGDLKGRSVGVQGLGGMPHTLATLMAAQVGLDPKTDIQWVTDPTRNQLNSSKKAKSMHSSVFRPSRRNSVPKRLATFWSIPRWTGLGPNTSAVCSRGIVISSASIR
jgi:NitT/TauT family transport system substrate-binding protein